MGIEISQVLKELKYSNFFSTFKKFQLPGRVRDSEVRVRDGGGRAECFCSLFKSCETLFWSSFGLIDLEHLKIKEGHWFTSWAGKTMFGTYNTIAIVVLLNMLIGPSQHPTNFLSPPSLRTSISILL